MTAPSPFAHSPARRHANVAAVARRSKPPFYRMIVMNRLSTENVFEDLDGLAEVEIARGLQLVWGSFSLWRSGRFSLEILHSYDCSSRLLLGHRQHSAAQCSRACAYL